MILSTLPKPFCSFLDRSNQEKRPNAPVALILQSSVDENGFIYDRDSQVLISVIAKTHRISIKTIEAPNFGQELKEHFRLTGRRVDLLIIDAHGLPGGKEVIFKKRNYWRPKPEDFPSEYLGKTPLLLYTACFVGQHLAKMTAAAAPPNSIVYASPRPTFKRETRFECCTIPEHKPHIYFFEGDREITKIFYTGDGAQELEQSCPESFFNLGELYSKKKGLAFQALVWYFKAAEIGHSPAFLRIAFLLEKGFSQGTLTALPVPDFANVWMELNHSPNPESLAHQAAFTNLRLFIAFCYEKGLGVSKNLEEAKEWVLPLALAGCPEAQCAMGRILTEVNRVLQKPGLGEEIRQWYSAAAAQGHPESQYSLGLLYHLQSVSNPAYLQPAMNLFLEAAKRGHAEAQCTLGNIHSNRATKTSHPLDSQIAKFWFLQAAKQGHARAQKFLISLQ